MGWGYWAIIFLILLLATPAAQLGVAYLRRRIGRSRYQRHSGARVVPLVLSMETIATYGLPLVRIEQLPLPEEVAAAIAAAPVDRPLDVLVDLPAGVRFDPQPVAVAMATRAGPTALVVPRRALTGGLTLARAADRVVLGPAAVVADGLPRADDDEHSSDPRRPAAGTTSTPTVPAACASPAPIATATPTPAAGMGPDELAALGIPTSRPDLIDALRLLSLYPEPHRPRARLPFFIRIPRLDA